MASPNAGWAAFGVALIQVISVFALGCAQARSYPEAYTADTSYVALDGLQPYPVAYVRAQVADAFGTITFRVTACGPSRRTVRAETIRKSVSTVVYGQKSLPLKEVFRQATAYAWRACPLKTHVSGDRWMVDEAVFGFAGGQDIAVADKLERVPVQTSPTTAKWVYQWDRVRSAEAAVDANQRANVVMTAGKLLYWGAAAAIFAAIGSVLWSVRRVPVRIFESVLRTYYFAFHPHPAQSVVRASLNTDAPLNGKLLANALGELPPGNRIFREVRMKQAIALFNEMQDASRERISALERRARDEYQRAAIIATQEALALAGVALERARAAFAASQSVLRRS